MCNEALLKGHRWRVRRETMYYGFSSMQNNKKGDPTQAGHPLPLSPKGGSPRGLKSDGYVLEQLGIPAVLF